VSLHLIDLLNQVGFKLWHDHYALAGKHVMDGYAPRNRRPIERVFPMFTNAFLKTTVRNNVSVLDFIVHYLLHVSATYRGRNM
jgi:hypothetical protein